MQHWLSANADLRTLFQSVTQTSPKFVRGLMLLASASGAVGNAEDAQKTFARAQQINSKLTADRFAMYMCRITGNLEAVARITFGLLKAGLLSALATSPAMPKSTAA